MDKPGRFLPHNEFSITFKTFMTGIFLIMDKTRWGMGDDDVDSPQGEQLQPVFEDGHSHLVFLILMWSAIVPPRSGETGNGEPLFCHHPGMDVSASHRRGLYMSDVVVALNVKEGNFVKGSQVGQVFGGEITTGKDEFRRSGERGVAS